MSSSKKHIPVDDRSSKTRASDTSPAEKKDLDFQESDGSAQSQCAGQEETCADKSELSQRIEKLEQENMDLLDRLQRNLAEFDNYRKRVSREKDDLVKYANEKMALDLLPVVDNFERALEQAGSASDITAVTEGIEMIYKQFLSSLEKYKIKSFESVGEQFTPEKHEAMLHQEHPDYDENTIVAELQKGYVLENKLLRPAQVIVSRGPAESCDTPEEA